LRQFSEGGKLQEQGEWAREVCGVIHELLEAAGLASQDLSGHPPRSLMMYFLASSPDWRVDCMLTRIPIQLHQGQEGVV